MAKSEIIQSSSFASLINSESDIFGAAASSLCLIHCLLTPVIFVVQASAFSCSEASPIW